MAENNDEKISRKEFIKKTSAGVLGLSLLCNSVNGEEKKGKAEYRSLGKTCIRVVPVGFAVARTMEPSLVKTAIDRGMNFLDTGRTYSNGRNEEMLGKVVRGIRDRVIIETKISIPFPLRKKFNEVDGAKVIKEHMQKSLEESLKALRTDYIDIMLVHDVRGKELINEEIVMEFLAKAKEQGKIRAHGFSVHTRQVEIIKSANKLNFYDVILAAYNHKGAYKLGGGSIKWDMNKMDNQLRKAAGNGTGIVAMKTCLSGPRSPGKGIPPTYMDAVKWVINHEFIHTTATAMANIRQIDENLGALG